MSRRVMVLLAATAMAVAMLAMAGMASAQQQEEEPEASTATATAEDTTTAEQDSSTAAPLAPSANNNDLKIKAINPKPGSETSDRTPLIKAKVTEDNNNDNNNDNNTIKKSDIKLVLDGDKKGNFDYKSGKGLIEFTPDNNLSFGKHTVKVVVNAGQGQKDREKWSFRVEDN
jgi:hypothetical protein